MSDIKNTVVTANTHAKVTKQEALEEKEGRATLSQFQKERIAKQLAYGIDKLTGAGWESCFSIFDEDRFESAIKHAKEEFAKHLKIFSIEESVIDIDTAYHALDSCRDYLRETGLHLLDGIGYADLLLHNIQTGYAFKAYLNAREDAHKERVINS